MRPQIAGSAKLPEVDLELAELHTAGLAMVGRASFSGVLRKISARITGRSTLRLEVGAGGYILKPQAQTFPHLPENEQLTLLLAKQYGIPVADSALVPMRDGTLAFLTHRFDRAADGRKRHQEDFCQLSERPAKDKYEGSAELCFRVIRRYATEPLVDALRLFRQLLYCWWTGNGDAHLKNFSILTDDQSYHRLSPAYDLLSTHLVIPDDTLALPVGGKRSGLTRRSWRDLGAYARLPKKVVRREIAAPAKHLLAAEDLIARSFLPPPMKIAYRELIRSRAGALRDPNEKSGAR